MPYELLEDEIEIPQTQQQIPQEESNLQYLGRTGARLLQRGAESALGLPGDIVGGIVDLSSYLTSGAIPTYEQFAQRGKVPTLPTSARIRKVFGTEYTEPQGPGEKLADEILGDAVSLFIPGAGAKNAAQLSKKALGSLGLSSVGNLAGLGTEIATGSPGLGKGVKLGTLILGGIAGTRRELQRSITPLYTKAEEALPQNPLFELKPEKIKFNTIKNAIARGDSPDKKFLTERLDAALNLFPKKGSRSNTASIKELINIKRDWNQQPLFNLTKEGKKIFGDIKDIVKEGIERYGKTNPKFYEPFKTAEQLYAGLNGANSIKEFIASHPKLQKIVDNPLIQLIALPTGAAFGYHNLGTTTAVAGAGIIANEAAKFYKLLKTSPAAYKAYKEFALASLNNNVSIAGKSLEKLNNEANKFVRETEPQSNQGRYELLD